MKATETLNQVKELLGLSAEKVELAQMALENGTIIEAESFAEGQEVFIVTEDERVALPVGDYKLEDGQTLNVQEEGIIASIGQEEEAEAEELEEEEMAYATKQELAEVKEMIEEIKAMIKDKEEMSEEKEELSEVEVQAEELSSQEPIEKVNHTAEPKTELKVMQYATKRPVTTYDRVMSKIINK